MKKPEFVDPIKKQFPNAWEEFTEYKKGWLATEWHIFDYWIFDKQLGVFRTFFWHENICLEGIVMDNNKHLEFFNDQKLFFANEGYKEAVLQAFKIREEQLHNGADKEYN